MKSRLDHLPERKQREIARIVEIIHEEFEDALKEAKSEAKRRGRILKIILFGSYAKGTWVDEPHTMKGYRSDYDILVIVNERRFAEYEFWDRATDHLNRDPLIGVPVGVIVHSARDVNNFLRNGQYFFADIRREGVVLYEMDDRELAEPGALTSEQKLDAGREHFAQRFRSAGNRLELSKYALSKTMLNEAAFELHQAVEQAYATVLLVLTNYTPPSHNLKFLRKLAEDRDLRLVDAWPRDQHRYDAWFNILNEAYVKARYSKHYEISEEALHWLMERTEHLHELVEVVCGEHLKVLKS
ncbi:nucleotidyltransferase and HEPN domain-containing protein [Pelagibacterium sp. H642]|uniref:nucleotidyltransferase and HEPN domain-containing protein n=1 Tax=Pelagibacterium sp. H642 TaxID=1881069 RepID=UPI002815B6DD|nr:nucleotidyltransferase and HEPN domain-containing protein [Pelagibacterium sp. H642]WMT92649.1 nucleotidyltransferase and HEPN domain-containing protein [Pelagibacterium sp. H642]